MITVISNVYLELLQIWLTKNQSELLSTKVSWSHQFPSLQFHLLSIAQSYVVSGDLHKAFIFFFPIFKWIANGSHEPLLFAIQTLLENIFYTHLRERAHYNPVTIFPPSTYFLSLIWPFCYSLSIEHRYSPTAGCWLSLEELMRSALLGRLTVLLKLHHMTSEGIWAEHPSKSNNHSYRQAAALPLRRHARWTAWGEPDHSCLWRTRLGKRTGQSTGSRVRRSHWKISAYTRRALPAACASYCCSSNVQKQSLSPKIVSLLRLPLHTLKMKKRKPTLVAEKSPWQK